jgi:hypothetical protein
MATERLLLLAPTGFSSSSRSASPCTRPRSWGLRTRTWAADGSSAERRRAGRLRCPWSRRRAESSDLRVPARLGGRRDIRSSKTRAEKLRPHGCRETGVRLSLSLGARCPREHIDKIDKNEAAQNGAGQQPSQTKRQNHVAGDDGAEHGIAALSRCTR